MTPLEILILVFVLLGIVLCILLSAYFSGTEMALSSCNQVRLENEAEEGDKKAERALKRAENFDDSLSTILIGNNLVNIAASALTTVGVVLLSGSDGMNTLATAVITILIIIFGETIPKIVAKAKSTRMARSASGFLSFLRILFWPVTFVIVKLVHLLTAWIKEPEEPDTDEGAEELQTIIDTAEDEGVIDADRSELLSAALDFKDITADEAMTARVDMEALDVDWNRKAVLRMTLACTHSRLPVYEGSIDHIIGVVHMNHLLKALSENREIDLHEVMLEPCFVYRTQKLPSVLDELKKARQHLAIVVDEYGGTLGVITMEDVLEQIVGDIWDETDEVEEEVVELQNGEMEIDGDMPIDSFLELVDIDPDDFDYESNTVGGWVTEYNEGFPEEGYSLNYANFTLTVTEMEERRVTKVRLQIHPEEEEEDK